MARHTLTAMFLCLAISVAGFLVSAQSAGTLCAIDLRCEFNKGPQGIDVPQPRLFWRVESGQRGQRQTAWQVLVASSSEVLNQNRGDLWDSGRTATDQTTFIRYAGGLLASSQHVLWKVRVWDRDGAQSPWSQPASWTMGLLRAEDWRGVWIAAPAETESLLLRKEFAVKPGLRWALVHASGMGQYELSFNGQRVGEDLLSPGWTDYRDTTLYDTHDVTALLHEGMNASGMVLGNGMYHVVRRDRFAKFTGSFGPLRAILHLRLEYADGKVEFFGTDDTWRVNPGPITYNSIYGGEDHDARLDPPAWDRPGFDDRFWTRAIRVVRPDGTLRGHTFGSEPVRAIETRQPVGAKTFPDGTSVYDFGQNASFMPRIRVSGPAGSSVRLTPAEVVKPDGTIYRPTMGAESRGISWWKYTKATNKPEAWFPKFYYLGSRYVRAEFFPPAEGSQAQLPKLDSIEDVIVHSTATPVGQFSCSNDMLNRIRDLVRWSQRSNMVSILTDCPHREKLGWIEQMHLNGPAIRYEFDTARLFAKSMHDMSEAQLADGLVPNIAPEYTEFQGAFRAAVEWGAALILVPWQQYQFAGDVDLLRTYYEPMKRYFAYLETRAKDDILSDGLGDWYDVGPNTSGAAQNTPPPVTATAFYFQDAQTLSRIAAGLGKADEAKDYAARAERIRASYHRRFFNRDQGTYATGSQCSNALALVMGIVRDPGDRQRVFDALVQDIEQHGYSVTAGEVGYGYLLQALVQGGRSDVIYRMVNQNEKPGYGFMLRKGETTLTESWDANLTSSHNHLMLGQINEWFYKDLVGIDVDPAGPGFKKIIIRPNPVEDLKWAQASYDSIHGPISVRWDMDGGRLALKVTIPANTTATVFVPLPQGEVKDPGAGATLLRREAGRAVYAIESGSYIFEYR
jgi:alpha-L-rhamnosidase